MKPSGVLSPGSLTLTTARLLVLALATNSIDSSGVSASELGVLPGGGRGSMAVPIVSTGLAGLGVEDRDGVAVGVGHVEDLAPLRQEHLVGMLLGLPAADDLALGRVDHGDLGVAPEAHVEPAARLVPGQAVGISESRPAAISLFCLRSDGVEPGHRVAEDVGDPERLAVVRQRQSRRHPRPLPRLLRRIGSDKLSFTGSRAGRRRGRSRRSRRRSPPPAIEPLAVVRPDQARERLGQRDPADDLARAWCSTVTTSCSP